MKKLTSMKPKDQVQFSDQEPSFIVELTQKPSRWVPAYQFTNARPRTFGNAFFGVRQNERGIRVIGTARTEDKIFSIESCRGKDCLVMYWRRSDYFDQFYD